GHSSVAHPTSTNVAPHTATTARRARSAANGVRIGEGQEGASVARRTGAQAFARAFTGYAACRSARAAAQQEERHARDLARARRRERERVAVRRFGRRRDERAAGERAQQEAERTGGIERRDRRAAPE